MPSERELATSFGVSRSSLRQALKVLEIMGVLSQRVGDGTYLNSSAKAILSEPMQFLILLDAVSERELMEARLIVEPELAAQAAERATEEDLAAIRAELDAMESASLHPDLLIEHDLRFHQAIFDAAKNRVCGLMFAVVHQSLKNLIAMTSKVVPAQHTLVLHKRILNAIRKRDPEEARRRMSEHLLDAKALIDKATGRLDQASIHERISEYSKSARSKPKSRR